MAQAFLHGGEHIHIAARLDIDHPVRGQACQIEGGGEEIAPAQAPEDWPLRARKDSCEKDRRRCVVGKGIATRQFVKRTAGQPATRQVPVNGIQSKRQHRSGHRFALDCGDLFAQLVKDCGRTHGTMKTLKRDFVPLMFHLRGA